MSPDHEARRYWVVSIKGNVARLCPCLSREGAESLAAYCRLCGIDGALLLNLTPLPAEEVYAWCERNKLLPREAGKDA